MKIKKQIDTKWRQWKKTRRLNARCVKRTPRGRLEQHAEGVCDTSKEREVRERAKRDVAEVYETKWAEEEGK